MKLRTINCCGNPHPELQSFSFFIPLLLVRNRDPSIGSEGYHGVTLGVTQDSLKLRMSIHAVLGLLFGSRRPTNNEIPTISGWDFFRDGANQS